MLLGSSEQRQKRRGWRSEVSRLQASSLETRRSQRVANWHAADGLVDDRGRRLS